MCVKVDWREDEHQFSSDFRVVFKLEAGQDALSHIAANKVVDLELVKFEGGIDQLVDLNPEGVSVEAARLISLEITG
jgi:hypothetical protein